MKIYLLQLLILLLFSCQSSTNKNDVAHVNETKRAEVPVATSTSTPPEDDIVENSNTVVSTQVNPNVTYPWKQSSNSYGTLLSRISVPEGYARKEANDNSFTTWLRNLPLKKEDSKVMLFNKSPKGYQGAQHAVVDLDVDPVDLQQCADAVMRLKAEFHYSKKEYDKIHFNYTSGHKVSFDDWRKGKRPKISGNKVTFTTGNKKGDDYKNFRKYMIQIFSYAGTASLTKELKRVDLADISPGDVFIQGGFPGHAVMVLDVVENDVGHKQFLLGQSYMPAQDFHILANHNGDGPWYSNQITGDLDTPEWTFKITDLKRWQ